MKTQTLSICVPNTGCTRNCPYCISKITGDIKFDKRFFTNLKNGKLENFARSADVSTILLTGKGEPLKSILSLQRILDSFVEKYPLELQTNGDLIDDSHFKNLQAIDTVAISIDSIMRIMTLKYEIDFLKKLGKTVRITYLLRFPYEWDTPENTVQKSINDCKELGVDQLTFRRITYPEHITKNTNTTPILWIDKYVPLDVSSEWYKRVNKYIVENGTVIRKLNFGTTVYDIDDISITAFDFCIQEESTQDDIRTLIYQEDGHLYTSWNSKASLIF